MTAKSAADMAISAMQEALMEANRARNGAGTAAPKTKDKVPEADPFADTECSIWASEETSGHLYSDLFPLPEGMEDFPIHKYNDEDWDVAVRHMIPEPTEGYVLPPTHTYRLMIALETDLNSLIYGPPGTGKTSLVKQVCSMLRIPYYRFQGNNDVESPDIFGSLAPTIDGRFEWMDGIVTMAAKYGGVLAGDEPFAMPAGISLGLNPLLEEDRTLVLKEKPGSLEDKVIKVSPRLRVVYCDNTGGLGDVTGRHAGVNVQNTASLDRFQMVLKMDYLPSDQEVNMIISRVPGFPETVARKMVQFANTIRTNYVNQQSDNTVSPRTLMAWAKLSLFYKDPGKALKACYLGKIQDADEVQAVAKAYFNSFGKDL